MSMIRFSAERLAGTGKTGILTPDSDGYYETVLGGLNTLNSVGQYYVAEGAKDLFQSSSIFMRRVKNGCLKIEVEHPAQTQGMSDDDYIDRLLRIDMNNVCGHISDVWLDFEFGKKNPYFKNPELVGIIGKVKPSGVKAGALEMALNNPRENVCFSVRSFTKNYVQNRRTYRVIDTIVTFDLVNEGGIAAASKWSSPVLESIQDRVVTSSTIQRIVEKKISSGLVGVEDSRELAMDVLKSMKTTKIFVPGYAKW